MNSFNQNIEILEGKDELVRLAGLDEADLVSLRFVYKRRATIRLRGIRLRKLPALGGA